MRLTTSVQQAARMEHGIVIVGTGPAGTAVAEDLYLHSGALITMLELGPAGLTTHFNNVLKNALRRKFIDHNKSTPWLGTMVGGMLVPGLGGRGTVAGANRPRFYQEDFVCFPGGEWPREVVDELSALFSKAELMQRVRIGDISCPAQEWTAMKLGRFCATPPRIAVDKPSGDFSPSCGYDSPAERLMKLVALDSISESPGRLRIVTDCYVTRIIHDGKRATAVCCLDTTQLGTRPTVLPLDHLVLAASPIESARLVLNSGLAEGRPIVGRFLAEHVERRSKIRVRVPGRTSPNDGISLVIPPSGRASSERFQIHLRGEPDPSDARFLTVDVGAFAAMEPQPDNMVTLALERDGFGVRKAKTFLRASPGDETRTRNMCVRIQEIVGELGGEYVTERFPLEDTAPRYTDETRRIETMAPGRSYHEAGTLRIGTAPETSACDIVGRLWGMDNVYVGDASLFPCVGAANPILTLSALGYWVSKNISSQVQQADVCA
ncbi:MAG: GMC family oxidoreductase N-terminal domain-containing protein [Acidobacteriia bacterium]|nr:GMC family oxidoreductase N-terminal domain-containing protein [Terriglobia bacterium]